MSGLVGYESSDGEVELGISGDSAVKTSDHAIDESLLLPESEATHGSEVGHQTQGSTKLQGNAQNSSLLGPFRPPLSTLSTENLDSTPQSPYIAHSTSLRELTMPQVPDMDIPPSPPGSPPPGVERKFEHFIELKRQGIHFNEKLAKSPALRNPSLLQKLMTSAGVDEQDQYNATLSRDIWNPVGLPTCAFKEELMMNQQAMTKRGEEEKVRVDRESVQFVSATDSGQSSGIGTPNFAVGTKGIRSSVAERVMAGLDGEKTNSLQSPILRGGRNEGIQHGMSGKLLKRGKR